MEEIIGPVDKELIKQELSKSTRFRKTNKGGNEIYILTAAEAPNTMLEIGRLREWAFRSAGGGSGKAVDTDRYDVLPKPYKQLIVWDPDHETIIGGYRYILGEDVEIAPDGQPILCTADMYHFEPKFISDYLPNIVELGRSFVHPDYQSSRKGAKSLFALDNLWDGLGALPVIFPQIKYCFGKITVYRHYNDAARDLIFGFMRKMFPDPEHMIRPIEPFPISLSDKELDEIFVSDDYKENLKTLNSRVRALGVNIPPLVNAYLGLSPRMSTFGFGVYHEFGEVIECCLMIPLNQMYEEKKKRHVESFLSGD